MCVIWHCYFVFPLLGVYHMGNVLKHVEQHLLYVYFGMINTIKYERKL